MTYGFPGVGHNVIIRGNDDSWLYEGAGDLRGKQRHLASAAEEIVKSQHINITRKSTLLLDDDTQNVKIALLNRVPAIKLCPENPKR